MFDTEEINKKLIKLRDEFGGITFMMEGDSQTVKGREFVWESYGSDMFKLGNELFETIGDLVELTNHLIDYYKEEQNFQMKVANISRMNMKVWKNNKTMLIYNMKYGFYLD